jgi:hypothetical protein
MDYELINLIIVIFVTINSLVLVPVFKLVFYLIKEINYIKGHLKIDL